MKIAPYGERAAYIDLEIEDAPDRASRTLAVAAALRASFPGADIVIGAGTLAGVGIQSLDAARAIIEAASGGEAPGLEGTRRYEIGAIYDGPDLAAVASSLGVAPSDVVAMHTGREVVAEIAGFLPGFAYLGPIDARLVLPRRPSPRPSVPALSVGIAGSFTGIYPFASPGGWNLLARAVDILPFDPTREPPMLIAPGDRVRFIAVEAPPAEAARPSGRAKEEPSGDTPPRALEILAAPAVATIQDTGREGQLHRGISPSGALDPETLVAANRAVGNPPDAAVVEIPLGGLRARARGRLLASLDGAPPVQLDNGEELRVEETSRAVRYLAVRGGVDVPVTLRARSTLLVARLGGFRGRPLRRGDVLPIAPDDDCSAPGASLPPDDPTDAATLLEIDPGPHVDRFPVGALDALVTTPLRVSRLGDRVGVRLEGGRVPRDRPDLALPVPMIRGAVQISTDGTPIVLGPDHPVTGGYPVLAVVRRASQARLARLRAGAEVRLRLGC